MDDDLDFLNRKTVFFYRLINIIHKAVNSSLSDSITNNILFKTMYEFGLQIEIEHTDMKLRYINHNEIYDGLYPFDDSNLTKTYYETRKSDLMFLYRLLSKFYELYTELTNVSEFREPLEWLNTTIDFFITKWNWDHEMIEHII